MIQFDNSKGTIRKIALATIIISGLAYLPFLILAFYNHPSADDFLVAVPAMEWGPITATLGWYSSWSSRFTAAFLLSVNPLVFQSLIGYQLMTWVLILSLLLGFYQFFRSLLPDEEKVKTWSMAILGTLVYITAVPSPVQALYYIGGATCYQPAHAMLLFLAATLIGRQPLQNWAGLNVNNLFMLGVKSALIILIAGCNEVAMTFQLGCLGGLLFFHFLETKTISLEYGLLFFVSIIGALLVIMSPATQYRMEASNSFHRGLPEVVQMSFFGFFQFAFKWLKTASVLLFFVFWIFNKSESKLPVLKVSQLALLSVFSVFLLIFCFVPSYLGEGVVQGRTANSLLFLFFILLFINILFWKQNRLSEKSSPMPKMWPYLPALVALLALSSPNSMQAWNDWLSGEGKAYHQEQMERIRLTKSAPGDSVVVPPIVHRPKTIFFGDIGIYPQPWYDDYYARYHGKKHIQLQKVEPKP